MRSVVIDPGHGGTQPGAFYAGVKESKLNLTVANLLADELKVRNLEVLLTRELDVDVSLRQRCVLANIRKPDLFVSLHCNAAPSTSARGFEVWTSLGETRSDQAAERVINRLLQEFPTRNCRMDWSDGDADQEAPFYVLKHTVSPAILVEMGFLSHAEERGWLSTRDTQLRLARAIAKGVVEFVNGHL